MFPIKSRCCKNRSGCAEQKCWARCDPFEANVLVAAPRQMFGKPVSQTSPVRSRRAQRLCERPPDGEQLAASSTKLSALFRSGLPNIWRGTVTLQRGRTAPSACASGRRTTGSAAASATKLRAVVCQTFAVARYHEQISCQGTHRAQRLCERPPDDEKRCGGNEQTSWQGTHRAQRLCERPPDAEKRCGRRCASVGRPRSAGMCSRSLG